MASARSTVSIARTTPAQKPRGEQSTTLRSGLADIGKISGKISGENLTPNPPSPPGRGRSVASRTWDCFQALSRHFRKPLRPSRRKAYIGPNSPSSLMTTGFALKRGGRSTKEICHEQRTADAQGDRRLVARQYRADLRSGRRFYQNAPA